MYYNSACCNCLKKYILLYSKETQRHYNNKIPFVNIVVCYTFNIPTNTNFC